jgi:hypothetical protein
VNQGSFEGIEEAPRKEVTKWKNYCGVVGKWKSVDLENGWIIGQ